MILRGAGAAAALLPIQPPFPEAFAIGETAERPYADPDALTKLPFGAHSHQLEPWRAYVETVPVTTFTKGIGVVAANDEEIPLSILKMIAACGVTNLRLEISWSAIDYRDESRLVETAASRFRRLLQNCAAAGLRPLILLNANHGAPTPLLTVPAQLRSDAPAGARSISVKTNARVIAGRTGLSNMSEPFWAAEILVTHAGPDGTLSLSKPLPRAVGAGEALTLATLKYEPFSAPGSARNEATLAGWLNYVGRIAAFAANALQTEGREDKGFDLEIWNELSFGTKFLYINNYYEIPVAEYFPDSIWGEIAQRTADYVAQRVKAFSGVTLVNGFASTVPWPASSEQHPRITALAKHPYVHYYSFPRDEQTNTISLDAAGAQTRCVPAYSACFPEYAATAIQTETIVRDLAPITTRIYDKDHGRNARKVAGKVSPVSVWLTEAGLYPKDLASADRDGASLKMLAAVRYLLFYLNKGAGRVFLYDLTSGDQGYGIVRNDALMLARTGYEFSPSDDRLLSPTLRALRRIVTIMSQNISEDMTETRTLGFDLIGHSAASPGASCISGEPAAAPDGSLVLLPFQANPKRFVIAYYAMSRNLLEALPLRFETVRITGLRQQQIGFRSYDPIEDRWTTPSITARNETSVDCSLTVRDMPQLLILEEQENA